MMDLGDLGGTLWPEAGRFRGDMDWPRFTAGFVALVACVVAAAFVAPLAFAASPMIGVVLVVAVVALTGAAAPQGYVFRVVRNVWWLSAVRSDRAVRWALLGLGLAALGALARPG